MYFPVGFEFAFSTPALQNLYIIYEYFQRQEIQIVKTSLFTQLLFGLVTISVLFIAQAPAFCTFVATRVVFTILIWLLVPAMKIKSCYESIIFDQISYVILRK